MISQTLLTLLLLTAISAQTCQPNYWESDPFFQIRIDDLSYVSSKGIQLTPLEQTKGLVPAAKTTYRIQNYTTTVTYDNSQIRVNRSDTGVTVSNGLINVVIAYHAQSKNLLNSSKKYNGKATAHLTSVVVTYTKSAVIKNGLATFEIKDVVITNTSQATPDGNYDPPLADSSEFDSLIKINITNQIITYYKTNTQNYLTEAISKTNIPFTFKANPYIYQFGDYNVSINTTATNSSIAEQGYLIGYAGVVAGKESKCSEFVPEKADTASFITYGLVRDIFDSFYSGNQGWQNMRLDQTNTKSTLFSFYMIDIEDIVPQALVEYPKYFDRIYASCSIDNSSPSQLNFLAEYRKINTTLSWNCGLFRAESNTNLLNFNANIDFRAVVSQVNTSIEVRVEYSRVSSVNLTAVDAYPITNSGLGELYVAAVVGSMEGYTTVGSRFLQPQRNNPEFVFSDENQVIEIKESAGDNKREREMYMKME